MLNTIYVLKYEKISNSLQRKVVYYLQILKKNRAMWFFFVCYKVFENIGLLKLVLKIKSFLWNKKTKME